MKKIIILAVLLIAIKAEAQKSLYTQDTLSKNTIFRQRIKSAALIVAGVISQDSTYATYLLNYSNVLISNPEGGWISSFANEVAADYSISYESSDADIQQVVGNSYVKVAAAYFNITAKDISLNNNNSRLQNFLKRKILNQFTKPGAKGGTK